MADTKSITTERVRTAELIASMCLATDLGMGFPFEHGLHATLISMRLCEALGVDEETSSHAYYASLLMYAGCTVDEEKRTRIFGGSMTEHHTHKQFGSSFESLTGIIGALQSPGAAWPHRAAQVAIGLPRAARFIDGHFAALCEVAGMLAERLGVTESILEIFPLLTERWDGASILKRASGDDVPLPIRIIHVGRDAAYQRLIGDDDHVRDVISRRAGKAFDPDVVAGFLENSSDVLGPVAPPQTVWSDVLSAEPRPWLVLEGPAIDRSLGAIGALTDLVSPYLAGHCNSVSELAAGAAIVCGMSPVEVTAVRRAGHVHDVGRIAVSSRIWDKPAALTADEREQVRLHTYHTDRVLARSEFLADVAFIASSHHERVDGSGYHRGLDAASLNAAARLLAVADAFQSKIEARPYRPPLSPGEAIEVLSARARDGVFDSVMVKAIAEVAGQVSPSIARPAGLTDREIEVLGLVAKGLQTKQVARQLEISPKTADRHIQNTYRKIGVSSRAAATLYASENGLIPR